MTNAEIHALLRQEFKTGVMAVLAGTVDSYDARGQANSAIACEGK